MEKLKLKVDEVGAKVESVAICADEYLCMEKPPPPPPREFIVDKTFWLVMKEKGKHPYLCIQISSPSEK